ncbi:hypothetical protein [Stackebrandtia nassauensis]|uniref:Uncharacterized protein n=1 Tax=Stackebrandtia nassauensis (strain DSM 44728 / CIP 108903 / NRRL B-16338 / NBRC 102104 / LLR-40K-21) TaxID=446470 RepID=D3Q4J9_STANL|nr:hypothetical protein [Stackebrandtia nassauensis]ADD40159.1 hypothetical protein Snas_0444 [Stackebrandtia nassauensis DSM 44728]
MNDAQGDGGGGGSAVGSELAKASKQIRRLATGREFEDEGYQFAWTDGDKDDYENPGWLESDWKQLTLDRYLAGPESNTKYGPANKGQNSTYYVVEGSEVYYYKYDKFAWVTDLLSEFGKGSPSGLHDICKSVKGVPPKLCAKGDWPKELDKFKREYSLKEIAGEEVLLDSGVSEMERWSGEAAATFVLAFGENLTKWEEALWGMYFLSEAVLAGVEAQTAIVIAARDDALTIAEKTANALVAVNHWSKDDLLVALGVAAAIIPAALSFGGFALTATIIGAGIGLSNTMVSNSDSTGVSVPESEKKHTKRTMNGDSPADILDRFRTEIGTIREEASTQEEELANKLERVYNSSLDIRTEKLEITYPDGSKSPADSGLGKRETKAHTSYLKDAAVTSFPQAASYVLGARDEVARTAGLDSDTTFHSEHRDSVSPAAEPWRLVRDLLQDITAANGKKVEDAGEVIFKAAVDMELVDGEEAANIEKTYDDLGTGESGRKHKAIP